MSDDEREQLYWHIVEKCLELEEFEYFFSLNISDSSSQMVMAGGFASSAPELVYNKQPVLYLDYDDIVLKDFDSYLFISEYTVGFGSVRFGISNSDFKSDIMAGLLKFQDGWHLTGYYISDEKVDFIEENYGPIIWKDMELYDELIPMFFNSSFVDSIIRIDMNSNQDIVYIQDMNFYAFNNKRPNTESFNLAVRFYNSMEDSLEKTESIYEIKSFAQSDDKIMLIVYNWHSELLLTGYFRLANDVWSIDSLAAWHQEVIVH